MVTRVISLQSTLHQRSLQIFHDVELNAMQRAHLIHGRVSRIARLLPRGDTLPKIEKAMKLGFDSVICTHLVALYVLHKNLDTVVPELRGEDCTLGTVSVSGNLLQSVRGERTSDDGGEAKPSSKQCTRGAASMHV